MDPSIQDLIARLNQLSEQFDDLREGVRKAVEGAIVDPDMALIRSRKVLEYVVRDVFVRRVGEPPGTRPLEGLIQRLVKDGHFPPRLEAYSETIRKLGNVGAHHFDQRITAVDVYQSLTQLTPILEWYFEVERPEAGMRPGLPANPVRRGPSPSRVRATGQIRLRSPSSPRASVPSTPRTATSSSQLLPGPRDRDGLPESLRFWKHRIEAIDQPTFTVGVIYGPSGCGKSSLVKAGLLPRLAENVVAVYVEATPDETEARLLNGLRKKFPDLAADLDLTRGDRRAPTRPGLEPGQKVLIVLDQFEQWLHANRTEQDTELAEPSGSATAITSSASSWSGTISGWR